ncbi:MAG: cardiolipin synthase [Neisseria sp.]|nr:cardiolipin synthase [Neisseria sp.]
MSSATLLLWLHIAAVSACVIRVLYQQRNTGAAFAWLIILFVFPLFGVLAYLLIGEPRLGMARAKRTAEMNRFYSRFAEQYLNAEHLDVERQIGRRYHGISRVGAGSTGMGAARFNQMRLLSSTDEIIDSMLADIAAAEHSCLLAFYIIDPQGRSGEVLEAVAAAARRGVYCSILADAVGSRPFFRSGWPDRLREAGVAVKSALPVGFFRTLFTRSDLRNHRKLLIVDGEIGYTGSFNLVDPKFFKQHAGVGEWVDVMMRCTGPVVLEMAAVFFADVAVEDDQSLSDTQAYLSGQNLLPEILTRRPEDGGIVAQVIPSAPEQGERVIYNTILCAVYNAEHSITITTPYFVPDEPLLTALTSAARRGVDVTLVVPAKVDSLMVRYASRAHYPALMAAGVKIALFQGGLLHAKTAVFDRDYALFGTVNMDMRSFFLNLEISLAVYDRKTASDIAALQEGYLKQCRLVEPSRWQQRARWWGLVENAVRLVSPLL